MEARMANEQEKAALREIRAETERLSDLTKTFFKAVTEDPRIKARQEARQEARGSAVMVPRGLKPVGT